jgi:hypothetical protein
LAMEAIPHKRGEPAAVETARRDAVVAHVRSAAEERHTVLGSLFAPLVESVFSDLVARLISLQRTFIGSARDGDPLVEPVAERQADKT